MEQTVMEYRCPKCNIQRYSKEDMVNHWEKPCAVNWMCMDCGGLISSYEEILEHDKRCEGRVSLPEKVVMVRSYGCQVCGKCYPNLKGVWNHTIICHELNEPKDEQTDQV